VWRDPAAYFGDDAFGERQAAPPLTAADGWLGPAEGSLWRYGASVTPTRSWTEDSPRLARWAAYGASVLAFGYAGVSLYWAVGGTAGLNTVGGVAVRMARSGGAAAAAVIAGTVLLKTLGGLLSLAMVRPWGRHLPRRAVGIAGLAGSALLILYGAVEVTGEALVETGVVRPASVDWTALRWHLGLWDPWFLIWGLLLAVATWGYGRGSRFGPPPGP